MSSSGDGEICAINLSEDLSKSHIRVRPWSRPIRRGRNYVTDGPYLFQPDSSYRNFIIDKDKG